MHHFGLDPFAASAREHMTLQASLMHFINEVFLLSLGLSGASALGDMMCGTIWFGGGTTETVFG